MAITLFNSVKHFTQFLGRWVASGGKLVDQNTANLRAMICVPCHNNKQSKEVTGKECSTCIKAARSILGSIRSVIIKNNATLHDRKLLVCGICGCDNKISVWIPNDALLSKEDANAFPSFCWKKKVSEGMDI